MGQKYLFKKLCSQFVNYTQMLQSVSFDLKFLSIVCR